MKTLMEKLKHHISPGSQIRNIARQNIFRFLCFITGVTTRGNLPETPHRDVKLCRVIRGKLSGMILAHPLTHTSPSFVLGLFEPHIPRAIHHYCKQGDVIYDIGANIGYHALLFALYVGADGQVFAFEPNPADNKSLRWNLSANGFTNVEVIDMAVADTTGIVSFAVFAEPGVHHIASDHEPADASLISVPTITLDDFVYIRENPAPSFVKIDVEGSELHVLQGGSQMLREYQPVVIVEVWPETRHQVMEIMTDCGYHIIEEHYNYGDIADMVFLPDE